MRLIRDTTTGSIALVGETTFTAYTDPAKAARATEVHGPAIAVSSTAYREAVADATARGVAFAATVNKVDNVAVARELARLILGPGGFFLSDGDIDRIRDAGVAANELSKGTLTNNIMRFTRV
jgi:hypothetical protein